MSAKGSNGLARVSEGDHGGGRGGPGLVRHGVDAGVRRALEGGQRSGAWRSSIRTSSASDRGEARLRQARRQARGWKMIQARLGTRSRRRPTGCGCFPDLTDTCCSPRWPPSSPSGSSLSACPRRCSSATRPGGAPAVVRRSWRAILSVLGRAPGGRWRPLWPQRRLHHPLDRHAERLPHRAAGGASTFSPPRRSASSSCSSCSGRGTLDELGAWEARCPRSCRIPGPRLRRHSPVRPPACWSTLLGAGSPPSCELSDRAPRPAGC